MEKLWKFIKTMHFNPQKHPNLDTFGHFSLKKIIGGGGLNKLRAGGDFLKKNNRGGGGDY